MAEQPWKIVTRPEQRTEEGKNVSGMVVYLASTSDNKQAIGQVAFDRKTSLNPDVPFEDKLDEVLDKARKAVKVLNEGDLAPVEGLQ
jgi:hypothetical protein